MNALSKSLNTKLLLIVVCVVALGGILAAFRQERVESERLQTTYDQRLQRLAASYQRRVAEELQQRQELLNAAHQILQTQLFGDGVSQPPPDFALARDEDGAWRLFDGISAVFVHRDMPTNAETLTHIFRSRVVMEQVVPLLTTSFSAVYFITDTRMTRIWPTDIVVAHQPDHDVTQEIFYTLVTPANNPTREPRWTPIYFDFYTQAWMISLIFPVYETAAHVPVEEHKFVGVMGADLDVTFLLKTLSNLNVDGDDIKSFIFDDQGELILHSDQRLPGAASDTQSYQRLSESAEIDKAITGYIHRAVNQEIAPGGITYSAIDGVQQHISYHPLENMNWYLSLYYPSTMIDEKLRATLSDIYFNIVVLTLLLSFILYCGLQYFVIRRIRALAAATASVSAKNWTTKVPEDGADEISFLGRSINIMLVKINDLIEGLNVNIGQLEQVNLAAKEDQFKMEQLAYYDHLTGLHNRILFKDHLRTTLQVCQRDKSHFALMYLDLDHFKRINDTLGHEAGDTLLIEVARRIKECLREEDVVARLGGDEFAVLLHQVGSPQYAYIVANKVIAALNRPLLLSGQEVVIGVSIGITLAPDDSLQLDALMKNADLAMYQAKEKGRNTFQFYTADMNHEVEFRLALESDLRSALKNQEFELYFQPVIDLQTGKIVCAEALLRWHHPVRGMVSPVDFIPVAEDSGLIVPIGNWVMRAACQQAKNIQKALHRPLGIAVNVSARQLHDNGFVDALKAALEEIRIAPEWLSVELTETTLMADGNNAVERLRRIQAMGVSIAIDDFGTGYSSLSNLKRLPINTVKIDRSFVEGLPGDEEDRAITTLIVAMANSLNYKVIVEGVETAAQLTFLTLCGCDYAQGYYFSKPVPADELMQLLFDETAAGETF